MMRGKESSQGVGGRHRGPKIRMAEFEPGTMQDRDKAEIKFLKYWKGVNLEFLTNEKMLQTKVKQTF